MRQHGSRGISKQRERGKLKKLPVFEETGRPESSYSDQVSRTMGGRLMAFYI